MATRRGLVNAEQCPDTTSLLQAKILPTVTHGKCASDSLTVARYDADTLINKMIGTSAPLHAPRDRLHVAAKPDSGDRNRTVNVIFHSILSYG